jgi:hypothetical protein
VLTQPIKANPSVYGNEKHSQVFLNIFALRIDFCAHGGEWATAHPNFYAHLILKWIEFVDIK